MPNRLARSLRELGEQAWHVYDRELNLRSVPDEQLIQHVGERRWLLVSNDRNILRRHHERAALRAHNVGAFFLNDTLNDSLCSQSQAIYRNWSEMKRLARSSTPPFLFLVKANSVVPLRRRHLGSEGDARKRRAKDLDSSGREGGETPD